MKGGNPFTAKETISTRVLQSPRLVTSDLSMMPETFVGQPVSVYLDFYNMGKSTLYNLMITVEGDFDGQGLEIIMWATSSPAGRITMMPHSFQ